jgi:hypothetical protein
MAGIRAFRRKSQVQSPPYKPSNRTKHVFPPQPLLQMYFVYFMTNFHVKTELNVTGLNVSKNQGVELFMS